MKEARWMTFAGAGFAVLLIVAVIFRSGSNHVEQAADGFAEEIVKTPVVEPSGFDEWLASGIFHDLKQGIALAEDRRPRMKDLIRTDPERAIREALTLSEWSRLPQEIKPYVEQPFSAVANVEVLIACGEKTSKTFISTELPDGGKMETFVYGRRNALGSKNGMPVQGIRLDGTGVLRPNAFQLLEGADEDAALSIYPVAVSDPGSDTVAALAGGRIFYFKDHTTLEEANNRIAELEKLPGPDSGAPLLFEAVVDGGIDFNALEAAAGEAAEAWTGTPRDMYVIMVDFPDDPGAPTDPVAFSNSLNTTISQQIGEMSYGNTHIVATVNPKTYRAPEPSSYYTNYPTLVHSKAIELVEADGVDLSPYETVCVLFPYVSGMGFSGFASIGMSRMLLNGSTNEYVVTHELGHNYGSSHASFWQVPGSDPVDPSGFRVEYGDFMDIMGTGALPTGHFNAWHKRNVGWLESPNWQSITNSGTYRIYRSDHWQTTGPFRGLEIDKGGGDAYWVGLRQEYPAYETFSRGAYLLWKKSGDNRSFLIDTTPQSVNGKSDGGLALGQTYSRPAEGVHITPVARGGQTPDEWMDITVNLGSFPGNSAPIASLNIPSNVNVRASVLLSVTASDPDGDELAYQWDIGDGQVKPNSPTIPAAWLSGGTASVSCVVSDMKGGTNRVSKSIVLSDPFGNWIQQTSGTTIHLKDIALGGGRLVAVGYYGKVVYSEDGSDWTEQPISTYAHLNGIVYSEPTFIAAGYDYDFGDSQYEGTILTSADGISWTRRYLAGDYLTDVAAGGGIYVAVGNAGTIIRSTDGINWSTVSSGTGTNLHGVSYGDGIFVAVGADIGGGPVVVLTSTDGLSWSNHSAGVDLDGWKGFYDVQYCNDRFLAGGWYARILHSTDQGQTFTTSMTGVEMQIPAFAYGNGSYFAAGITSGIGSHDINLVSADGEHWVEMETPNQENRNASIFFNGTFITVGQNGSIWQSDSIGAPGEGYAIWQFENAGVLGLDRDPLDDADFDGHPNLVEYALGTLAFDAGSLPGSASMGNEGGYFQISYDRAGIAPDVDYAVERGANLASNDWSSAQTVTLEDSRTNLTVRSAFLMATQTNEFMRLNIGLK